jgi:hypothetical protein
MGTQVRSRHRQSRSRSPSLDAKPCVAAPAETKTRKKKRWHNPKPMLRLLSCRAYQVLQRCASPLAVGLVFVLAAVALVTSRIRLPEGMNDSLHGVRTTIDGRQERIQVHTFSFVDGPILLFSGEKKKERIRTTHTIWMAAPSPLEKRRLNYYHDSPSMDFIDYNNPDSTNAFPLPTLSSAGASDEPCYPIAPEWQNSNYQTCNDIHSLHMTTTLFISCGSSRCAFRALLGDDEVAVKVPNYWTEIFDGFDFQMALHDTNALTQLTPSPYALDIYQTCGYSKVLDYSAGGTLWDLIKRTRKAEMHASGEIVFEYMRRPHNETNSSTPIFERLANHTVVAVIHKEAAGASRSSSNGGTEGNAPTILVENPLFESRHTKAINYTDQRHQLTSPITKLQIALHLTAAVADLHMIEAHPQELAAIVHNDLCCHQFLLVDGVYKLGDLDTATFTTVRKKKKNQGGPAASATKPKETASGLRAAKSSQREQLPQHGDEVAEEESCQVAPMRPWNGFKILPPEVLPYFLEDSIPNRKRIHRDKIDVFGLGNVLYLLLTNSFVWEGYHQGYAMQETFFVSIDVEC